MLKSVYDLVIIGGGINGAGIARDAAGRGLSVLLCEQNDLASATSSASSKLIHGGLRYLEYYEFGLVRKALKEREVLLKIAPHLVSPMRFILPHNKLLRPAWMIRCGLFLYDHLNFKQSLPKSKQINLLTDSVGVPLKKELHTGFSYSDCWVDDARLVIANAMSAKQLGAEILTRTQCISAYSNHTHWTIELKNTQSNKVFSVQANAIINAAGPWTNKLIEQAKLHSKHSMRLIKGSHIVVPKLYDGDHAYLLQHSDKRIVFVMPYEKQFNLIGTTDIPYSGNMQNIAISAEEVNYLCNVVNHYFSQKITNNDVIWSYAGVRPLLEDEANNPSAITRDYTIEVNTEMTTPFISIFGGKITTYRKLAENTLEKLAPFVKKMQPKWTATQALNGGNIKDQSISQYIENLAKSYNWLPKTQLVRYIKAYGANISLMLQGCNEVSDLGQYFGADLYEKEVRYLVTYEWGKSAEDIIWRRSKLGLVLSKNEVENLQHYLQCLPPQTSI